MPIYQDVNTLSIVDLPASLGEHPVLGRSLTPYPPAIAVPVAFLDESNSEAPKPVTRAPRAATQKKEAE